MICAEYFEEVVDLALLRRRPREDNTRCFAHEAVNSWKAHLPGAPIEFKKSVMGEPALQIELDVL